MLISTASLAALHFAHFSENEAAGELSGALVSFMLRSAS